MSNQISMIGIDDILKKRFLELIKTVNPTGRWKLVVVDSLSSKILNSACKMYDILEENVTLVENIEKPRQPYPSYEAIYILTPCIESCSRLVDDFSRPEGKMYAAAHVHFINALENNTFNEFTRLLSAANAANDIKSLKEMYVDFLVRENCVYSLDDERKFLRLFANTEPNSSHTQSEIEDIAKQLLCVCVTLGENPLIRYHRPLDIKETINRRIPEQLAKAVQSELDNFCATNPEYPPPRDPPLPSGTLIILDRTIDPISPFLHEFTYQAMIADLLEVEEIPTGLKYEYKYTQEDGTTQDQEVTLVEADPVYCTIRHMHIANTTDKLINDFNAFINENQIAGSGGPTTAASLNDMKNIISNLPQYQEMKSRFSAHMNIASECMSEFKSQNLEEIGLLEQDMACGETPEGEKPTNLVEALVPILDDPLTSQMVKTRLILLWIATSDQIDPEDLEQLMAVARLEQEYKDAIDNIKFLGVQLSKTANKLGKKSKKGSKKKVNPQQEVPFDLSRYVPVVKRIVEGHINGTIDQSLFPNNIRNVKQQSTRKNTEEAVKEVPKLRVYKTQWHKKSTKGANAPPKPPSGPPIIIFIVGGMTYSEIRSAYEIAEAFDREVYIGSTHIITPDHFVTDLSKLDKNAPSPKGLIPPYTGSIHKSNPVSTHSQPSLPPRVNSSLPSSNSKGHKILGKW
ncbi:Sec1-like protein [Blakeslea trispora]|nr:Sec1-like protein [Blakeslea trispora]